MNYIKVHNDIINLAKIRVVNPNEYYEVHHIVPRCMGGDNELDNLVKLTAREHFLVHWLLVEMNRGNEFHSKLTHSWNMMCRIGKGQSNRSTNSRLFKYAREERSKLIRKYEYDTEIVIFDNITREVRYVGPLRFCGVYPARVYERLESCTPSVQGRYKFCSYYREDYFLINENKIKSTPWDTKLESYQKGSKSDFRKLKVTLSKGLFSCETTLNDFSYSISRFYNQALIGHTYKHGPLKKVTINLIK